MGAEIRIYKERPPPCINVMEKVQLDVFHCSWKVSLSYSVIKKITWRNKTVNIKSLEGAKYGKSKSPKIWNGHRSKIASATMMSKQKFCWSANTRQSENEKFLCLSRIKTMWGWSRTIGYWKTKNFEVKFEILIRLTPYIK